MTVITWFKHYHGAASDPKWLVIADRAGSSPALAWATFSWALEYASKNETRGSLVGFDPELIAAFYRVGVEEICRLLDAMRAKGIILADRIANWTKRQAAEKPPAKSVTAGAKRTAAYRARLAEKKKEPELPGLLTTVTQGVTVTTEEEEGYAFQRKIPESVSDSESVAAREGLSVNECDSFGREAPFAGKEVVQHFVHLEPASDTQLYRSSDAAGDNTAPPVKAGGNVVQFADGVGPKLKSQKKELRRQKVLRFIKATYADDEYRTRFMGMMGADTVRDEQWWFDKCDAERILAGWDDVRDSRQRLG